MNGFGVRMSIAVGTSLRAFMYAATRMFTLYSSAIAKTSLNAGKLWSLKFIAHIFFQTNNSSFDSHLFEVAHDYTARVRQNGRDNEYTFLVEYVVCLWRYSPFAPSATIRAFILLRLPLVTGFPMAAGTRIRNPIPTVLSLPIAMQLL